MQPAAWIWSAVAAACFPPYAAARWNTCCPRSALTAGALLATPPPTPAQRGGRGCPIRQPRRPCWWI
uniref:Secreted protein n=1 Tax=Oryza punctata TaxID=4537 RepID=A0A0E0L1C1_ORYPU